MERIGIAASKIAKGNLLFYNFCVVVIASVFSFLIFLLSGSSIFAALLLIIYITQGHMPQNFEKEWTSILAVCMISLTVVIGLFNLCAILKNLKLKK